MKRSAELYQDVNKWQVTIGKPSATIDTTMYIFLASCHENHTCAMVNRISPTTRLQQYEWKADNATTNHQK